MCLCGCKAPGGREASAPSQTLAAQLPGYAVKVPKFDWRATLPAGASAAAARSNEALPLATCMHVPTACRGAMQKQPRVVIIGGGAAGMACAWSLAKSSVAESVTVLEPSPHPGGVASTIDYEIGGCKLRINIGVQGALRRIPLEAFFAFVL